MQRFGTLKCLAGLILVGFCYLCAAVVASGRPVATAASGGLQHVPARTFIPHVAPIPHGAPTGNDQFRVDDVVRWLDDNGFLRPTTIRELREYRTALWRIVGSQCVPHQRVSGAPRPCEAVDLSRGFAVIRLAAQHLLIVPTVPIDGIEDPALLGPAVNYLKFAWDLRGGLDLSGVGIGRDQIGLAINSPMGRNQDQLHIHLGCVRAEVRAALNTYDTAPVNQWSTTGAELVRHRYRVMRIEGEDLTGANPFQRLAEGVKAADQEMIDQTLVVVGATFKNGQKGFYLLNDSVWNRDRAIGEELLDHRCTVGLSL